MPYRSGLTKLLYENEPNPAELLYSIGSKISSMLIEKLNDEIENFDDKWKLCLFQSAKTHSGVDDQRRHLGWSGAETAAFLAGSEGKKLLESRRIQNMLLKAKDRPSIDAAFFELEHFCRCNSLTEEGELHFLIQGIKDEAKKLREGIAYEVLSTAEAATPRKPEGGKVIAVDFSQGRKKGETPRDNVVELFPGPSQKR